jgi:hypothetical protein
VPDTGKLTPAFIGEVGPVRADPATVPKVIDESSIETLSHTLRFATLNVWSEMYQVLPINSASFDPSL